MDLDLVVAAGGLRVPVLVTVGEDATVADLRAALAAALDLPDRPVGPHPGRALADRLPVARAGLVRGGVLHMLGTGTAAPVTARSRFELAVIGGPHATTAVPLPDGVPVIVGRAPESGLTLADPEVSRVHAQVTWGSDGLSVTDVNSRNGIRVRGWRVDGETVVGPGEIVGIGESLLLVRQATATDADLTDSGGDRLFNRPPRIRSPWAPVELLVPEQPKPLKAFRFPWVTTLLPLVFFGGLYLIAPQTGPTMLVMMLLSPLMAAVNLVSDRQSGRGEHRAAQRAHIAATEKFDRDLEAARKNDEIRAREEMPDLGTLLGLAGVDRDRPAAGLWPRRRTDTDFLRLRVGIVDRPVRVSLRVAGDTKPPLPVARAVPVAVDLADVGVFGVAGARETALAAVRAMVAQSAVLHGPAELGLVLVTGRDTAEDWEWASWLPHSRPETGAGCRRAVAVDAEQAAARVAELRVMIEERAAARRTALSAGPVGGRAVLLVLDGARRLREVPGLAELLAEGPAAGVYALCLDTDATALPDECRATMVLDPAAPSRALLRRPGLAETPDVLVDGLVPGAADALGRTLAPVRPLGDRSAGTNLPDRVRFAALADLLPTGDTAADADKVLARWRDSPDGRSTTALLGVGADGPVAVDLRRDGPHALIAGTSGAGKSELLQTLVASLAAVNTPDALTFVLVDYKGGSAFAACAELPHCVGLVTDLDGHLVTRALASLSAELRRRERLLAGVGAKDIEDYWARSRDRLPRLVIVVDEFASLVEEVPEFVTGVVGIGMRGRSLGVHVVLATQRPGGVVTADLRANVNLRIGLRVTSTAESLDVVDAADAARIPARLPGRAYLRTGHSELTGFQAARVGWPRAAADGPSVTVIPRRLELLGRPPVAAGAVDAGGHTDLTDLVAAIRAAARRLDGPTPGAPWLPPLPEALVVPSAAAEGVLAAPIGVIDRPDAQTQEPFVIDLDRTGPLAVAGALRAGRSTALRTYAATLADGASPADLHLYGLDCGTGALDVLAALPHCGAVVSGNDVQRAERLVDFLHEEVGRRQRRFAAEGHAGLAEQRAAARPPDRLPYLVLLLDRLEAFTATFADRDGGRLLDRLEHLLGAGPAVGVTAVLSTDRAGFGHRIGSSVGARLVLRLAEPDEAAVFGVDPRGLPSRSPDGRGTWVATGEQVQVGLLAPDPAGTAQAAAVRALARTLTADWAAVPACARPRRIDPLPTELTAARLAALRVTDRPAGPAVCTPAAGGDHLGPLDVDLDAVGGGFVVAGPARSGKSTALLAVVDSLAGRADATLPVLVVTPRPSPLRELAGAPGVLDVLTDEADVVETLAALTGQRFAIAVDDAERISDFELTERLESLARSAQDGGPLLLAAVATEDLLANHRYRGWLATLRRTRTGVLLNPGSCADGEVFDLRLPRTTAGGWPPGRALLVRDGNPMPAQVPLPVATAGRVR
ncbi:FtsK/SpoIIIE domain-containing protein [Actinokineospora enzanensis]|uniref:FtsK/SpoIIIE domain-containing protein n=1 Tax=Actinokineospora enzanensis TaxID=155975 RepID=UPI00035DADD1|nr:FtsK/SpoIIIE domain-containing protein [Actinokineospora enzanensis]